MINVKIWFEGLAHIFMPRMCCGCDTALLTFEQIICTECSYHLPLTDFHLDPNNESAKQLWGKLDVEFVSSMLYLNKSSRVERLLHRLKFKGYPEIGVYLGSLYAAKLLAIQEKQKFDFIIPIPLHPIKFRKRGYNQAECFAKGLAEGLKIPLVNDVLTRKVYSESQVTKSRVERYDNVDHVFSVHKDEKRLDGLHVLLVDDVLTTGATLCAAGTILKNAGARVSIVTIARA